MPDCECKSNSGMGCLEVAIVVLVVLWLVGYWDKPKEPAAAKKEVPELIQAAPAGMEKNQ